ncbi:putative nucleotidyltransferase, Ribonuclease H [Helianthus annuus]|nr:putative nucleotidyltransferase, Ribonuclease H [Helianthus annuus]
MATRNQEVERLAKDINRIDAFTTQNQETLMSLKAAFDQMQATFSKMEQQGTLIPRNEGDRLSSNRLTKVEFPKFNGDDVEGWLYKCEHFFSIDDTPEKYKVRYAAVHLEGRALQWHQGFMKSTGKQIGDVTWDEYTRNASTRFAATLIEDAMGALKALTQTGELEDYCDEFDLLLNKVTLPDEYTISLFIEGLKPEIKCHVRMFKPKTLRETYSLARMQNQSNKILGVGSSSSGTGYSSHKYSSSRTNNLTNIGKQPVLATPVNTAPSNAIVPKKVSNKYLDDKRAKGECFYCNEKYVAGHSRVCKGKKQLFLVEVDEYLEDEEIMTEEDHSVQGDPHISLNAIMGIPSFSTMQVVGRIGTKYLYILLDSGSTHNFMSKALAQKLKCPIKQIQNVQITVADGNKVECVNMCKDFQWVMQGNWFTADVLVIDLNNYDLVLGIQWLETLDDIVWNFKNLTMKFNIAGQDFELKGTKRKGVKISSMEKITSLIQEEESVVQAQLFTIQDSADNNCMYQPVIGNSIEQEGLEKLLKAYDDIFEVPKGLPPVRMVDHRIRLKDENVNLNLKPYRYPTAQKDIIEQMTQELLDSGVIRHSNSSFAAPVVLVKKKDGSWRMCVDYRRLNEATIKDVFPIPLIEELLDELQGASIFSKLDLRSGYHQVRMYEPDIYKTAFKTHQGHYEFLVLPFGLTNAPATFQSLMNSTFKEVLRKCALVFFDDILVYSSSWHQHLQDLQTVLQLMRDNSLKAKRSKCSFAGGKVEYLGHVITEKGVSTDPTKLIAIQEWPTPGTIKELRGFLGLAGYYRRFIKNFGVLAKPLTELLRKDNFKWNDSTQQAFLILKQALSTPPVLKLPDFSKTFIVETDASAKGMGAVLMQEGHPLAFISKALSNKQQSLSVYEKELMAIIMAVKHWHHYLVAKHFVIKTDHQSLKHLLEQKIVTPLQQKWLSKLLGYDYEISYKKGVENVAADALSRMQGMALFQMSISSVEAALWERIVESWQQDPHTKAIIDRLQNGEVILNKSWNGQLLKRKNKILIANDALLRKDIINIFHSSALGGHSGVCEGMHHLSKSQI